MDKAIGGHIRWGESPTYTMMIETVQELRVPSIVLRTEDDFVKTFAFLHDYLDNIAILEQLNKGIVELEWMIDGKKRKLKQFVHLYIGVYTGSTKPVDKEASGVLYYALDVLKEEMGMDPDLFTYDLHFYLKKYEEEINAFLEVLKNQ